MLKVAGPEVEKEIVLEVPLVTPLVFNLCVNFNPDGDCLLFPSTVNLLVESAPRVKLPTVVISVISPRGSSDALRMEFSVAFTMLIAGMMPTKATKAIIISADINSLFFIKNLRLKFIFLFSGIKP